MAENQVSIGFDGLQNMKAEESKSEPPKTRKWTSLFTEKKE